MPPPLRPFVLVTGASRGIGLALARGFAARGRDVFLVARDAPRLASIAHALKAQFGVHAAYAEYDLAQPHASAIIIAALTKAGGYVDILVNCAGIAVAGGFVTNDRAEARRTLNLNVEAATELMYACLPGMVERGAGGVLNVASLAGMTPMPYLALYGATKSYLVSLSRAVACELSNTGVTISVILPGPVDTAFFASNWEASERGVALLPGLTPETVARTAIEGFLAGQTVITPGLLGALSRMGLKLLPWRLLSPLLARAARSMRTEDAMALAAVPQQSQIALESTSIPPVPDNGLAIAAQA